MEENELMPFAPARLCSRPGCRQLGNHSHYNRDAEQRRGSSTERGYDRRWQRLREMVLKEEPLCRYCKARGLIVASDTVDHMTPKARGGTDDRGNLCGACEHCNYSKGDKTAEEFL